MNYKMFQDSKLFKLPILRTGSKFIYAIIDQGIFSGGNFIINILLARWLLPEEYGAYAFAFSVFLFFAGIQSAIILEPLAVLGATKHESDYGHYVFSLLLIQLTLTLSFSFLLILSSLFLDPALKTALQGLAISMPFILIQWLFRQAFYTRTQPINAVKISAIYTFILVFITYVAKTINQLNQFNVFLFMGISCLVASALFMHPIGLHLTDLTQVHRKTRSILNESWGYGKWIVAASVLNWISSVSFIPVITIFFSLFLAAAFRSMQNLVLPLQQVLAAVSLLLIPLLSIQGMSGTKGIKRGISYALFVNCFIVISYMVIMLLFKDPIILLLYPDSSYEVFSWLLPWLGLSVLISVFAQVFNVGLRALVFPEGLLWVKLFSAIGYVTIGLFAIWKLNYRGLIIVILVGPIVKSLTSALFFRHGLSSKELKTSSFTQAN